MPGEQGGQPTVAGTDRSAQRDQRDEQDDRDDRDQHCREGALRIHVDQLTALTLPPHSQGHRDQERRHSDTGEHSPGPAGRLSRRAVGELTPHPGPEHTDPVADRGVDPGDCGLEDSRTREQRGGEGQAGEDER